MYKGERSHSQDFSSTSNRRQSKQQLAFPTLTFTRRDINTSSRAPVWFQYHTGSCTSSAHTTPSRSSTHGINTVISALGSSDICIRGTNDKLRHNNKNSSNSRHEKSSNSQLVVSKRKGMFSVCPSVRGYSHMKDVCLQTDKRSERKKDRRAVDDNTLYDGDFKQHASVMQRSHSATCKVLTDVAAKLNIILRKNTTKLRQKSFYPEISNNADGRSQAWAGSTSWENDSHKVDVTEIKPQEIHLFLPRIIAEDGPENKRRERENEELTKHNNKKSAAAFPASGKAKKSWCAPAYRKSGVRDSRIQPNPMTKSCDIKWTESRVKFANHLEDVYTLISSET